MLHVDRLQLLRLPGLFSVAGSGYATVEDEGVALTQRTTINFTGAGVSVADSGGKTVVTISGGGGGGGSLDDILMLQALLP